MGWRRNTHEARRARMVENHLARRDIVDRRVLEAMAFVPRHEFVPAALAEHAYDDVPLPIGADQTISQPYVVAWTAQALQLAGHERVLEIGTGSGYAAAVLGRLAAEVETVERIESHARDAAERLARLGYANVHVHHADGSLGWPARAPYQGIAVAAGAPYPPQPLLDQLALGGRLVLPLGPADHQQLVRITRTGDVTFEEQVLGEVRFVPLLGAQGWPLAPPRS